MSQGGLPLQGIRVVEYGRFISGPYCARLLGEFGAQVLKVEEPQGDIARSYGPFPGDIPHPERSGLYISLNYNKQGVTLDLDTAPGRASLGRLLADADVFVSNYPPRYLEERGLDYPALEQLNPRLVGAYISPYGQTGPYRDYRAYAINCSAAGGTSIGLGARGRLPLTMPLSLGEFQAGVAAASGALAALLQRDVTREGQLVDISEAEVWATIHNGPNILTFLYLGVSGIREGNHGVGWYPSSFLPCKDGYVCITCTQLHQWVRFLELMGNPDWTANPRYRNRRAMAEQYPDEVDALLVPWLRQYTRAELTAMGLRQRIPVAGAPTVAEVLEDPHLKARGFFQEVGRPETGMWRVPGPPYQCSATPAGIFRPAPLLGEHNEEVLRRGPRPAGREAPDPGRAWASEVAGGDPQQALSRRPLEGCRVLDFSWVWAGPMMTQMLADMGAEVIKVESRRRLDATRLGRPIVGDRVAAGDKGDEPELQPLNHGLNRGKRSITVDLSQPRGVELLKDVVRVCDVVTDNFSAGVLARRGLGYEALRVVRPDIVVLSLSGAGQYGPSREIATFAPTVSTLAGLSRLIGYEGEEPLGRMKNNYGDTNASLRGLYAVLVALFHRRRTGQGQFIDLSQWESAVCGLEEGFLELQMTGRGLGPQGNRHRTLVPHGNYPCQGEDRWVSIAVGSAEEWRGLCQAMGDPAWAQEPRFSDAPARMQHRGEMDELLARWTARFDMNELTSHLQRHGVAAAPVMNIQDQYLDPHFRERGIFLEVEHPRVGIELLHGMPWKLSKGDLQVWRHAPLLGQDNAYVLTDLLGLSPESVTGLAELQVLH